MFNVLNYLNFSFECETNGILFVILFVSNFFIITLQGHDCLFWLLQELEERTYEKDREREREDKEEEK